MFDLRGKVALVTGGGRGIGKAIAWALATAGADVAVNYVSEPEKAEEVVRLIRKMGQRSIAVRGDVSKKDEVEAMVARVELELGDIDVLVNNAGILLFEPFLTMSEANWDKVIDVNLKGQFLVAQAVARGMVRRAKGGRILNLASIASGQVGIGYPNIAHEGRDRGRTRRSGASGTHPQRPHWSPRGCRGARRFPCLRRGRLLHRRDLLCGRRAGWRDKTTDGGVDHRTFDRPVVAPKAHREPSRRGRWWRPWPLSAEDMLDNYGSLKSDFVSHSSGEWNGVKDL